MLEALLVYGFSWIVLPSDPDDDLNSYVFPLAVLLMKREKMALAPFILGIPVHMASMNAWTTSSSDVPI